MKWHAQVLHVARKDLLLSRWLLLAYAVAAAGATAAAVEWGVFAAIGPPLGMLGLVALGTVLFAFLVQADSPARKDALWVILPLHRSAVFAAKLLSGILVVIGIPLIGQLVGLQALDVARADLPGLLGRSVLSYGAWLAVVAAVAALTSDLRSFVVALSLAGFAWLVAVQAAVSATEPFVPSGRSSLPWLAGGMLLLVGHQYLTRHVRRGALLAAVLAVAALAIPAVPARSAAAVSPTPRTIPEPPRPAALAIGDIALKPGHEAAFMVRLTGMSPFHHYVLVSPTVRLHAAGASSIVRVRDGFVSLNSPIARLEGLRELSDLPHVDSYETEVSVYLTPAQRQALAAGDARLSLEGRIEVREPRAVAELPLRAGAVVATGGRRVRIVRAESRREGPVVEVRTASVGSSGGEGPSARMYLLRAPGYLLVNPSRREALQLQEGSRSGSDLALVLPGPSGERSSMELIERDRHLGRAPRIGPDWLRAARLVLLTWVPVGSDPITVRSD